MRIVIPSYKRPDVITLNLLKYFDPKTINIYVNNYNSPQELDEACNEYKKNNPTVNIIGVSTHGVQNIRNFVLNSYPVGEKLLMLDDDIVAVKKLNYINFRKKLVTLTPQEIYEFVNYAFEVTEKNNAKLWGVFPVDNYLIMKNEITNGRFIIGTMCGIINNNLRYDEKLPLKEDYDFIIKNILKYKKAVRFENITITAKHYSNKGGCVELREQKKEQEKLCANYLLNKYPTLLKRNNNRQNELILCTK